MYLFDDWNAPPFQAKCPGKQLTLILRLYTNDFIIQWIRHSNTRIWKYSGTSFYQTIMARFMREKPHDKFQAVAID